MQVPQPLVSPADTLAMLDVIASHVRPLGRGWSLGTVSGRWVVVRWPRFSPSAHDRRITA